jgi:murein DD-endopeptidase MepM/ murein hydrolase activator NlpD
LFLRRGTLARRKPGQALVLAEAGRLPTVYLGETKPKRELPQVYLCEAGQDGASHRLKWLASTCLAGMVGVCLIGFAVYASMNMSDGKGMVSSIKQASLAALKPMRSATLARDGQSATVDKGDRIQLPASGFTSRNVIHETVVEHQGSREYITIKPYLRIVAGLATTQPDDADTFPPFNPFKLYSDATPVGSDGDSNAAAADAPQAISLRVSDLSNGALPQEDGVELKAEEVNDLIAEAAENLAYADPNAAGDATGSILRPEAYRTDNGAGPSPLAPNITIIHKTADDQPYDDDDDLADMLDGSDLRTVKVGRGDPLASIITKVGVEPSEAKDVVEAMDTVFPAQNLKQGQEVHLNLIPAPSDNDAMEPVRVSVFGPKGDLLGSVSRNRHGDYVVSNDADPDAAKRADRPQHATLYTSFYRAALSQHIPPEIILKLLRVHSYDVDFKHKVKPGDSFDVFFDVPEGSDRDTIGELLYTSMTIDGQTRSFYRFRTPDGLVDYYDAQGNSAKKFLMRNPVKGGRYTSGFGPRIHPLLGTVRMHTGVDWAAPIGTPIVAGADGTVESVGRQGGYGNYVRIRHANGFATAYGHMSRFAEGLAPGVSVKQGQVVGYVGSTGFSTGPHCHYEILVNNKFVNPMTIQVPRGLQLQGRQLAEFQKERNRVDELRQMDPVTSRVAQATTTAQ